MRQFQSISIPFAVLYCLCLCLVGCHRADVPFRSDVERREVRFCFGVAGTKASVADHENDVLTLDVMVFRQTDGVLDAHSSSNGTAALSVNVLRGQPMNWIVVANAPASLLEGISSYSELLSRMVMLEDNTPSSFVMFDMGSWGADGPSGIVSVSLCRYVSKVTVRSVRVTWLDAFRRTPEISLERIALINVNGSVPISGVPTCGSLWYNRLAVDEGPSRGVDSLFVAPFGIRVSNASAVTISSSLYAMPNPVSPVLDSETAYVWSERATMVAVELLIDGVPNWYSVALPSMECNCHYVVNNLVITGPGASVPGGRIERQSVSCEIVVTPWNDASSGVVFPID